MSWMLLARGGRLLERLVRWMEMTPSKPIIVLQALPIPRPCLWQLCNFACDDARLEFPYRSSRLGNQAAKQYNIKGHARRLSDGSP